MCLFMPEKVVMSKKKTLRYILIAFLLLMLTTSGWFAIRYPGITKGSMDNFFNSKMVELTNLTYCVMYWIEFMGYLRWDETQDAYTFDGVDESNLDAFERGQLAFHRGDFETAITLMEEGIATKGESEHRLFWLALTHMRQAETVNCLDMLITDNQPMDESDHMGMNAMHGSMHGDMHGSMHNDMDHSRMCSLPLVIHHTQKEHSTLATEN